MERVAKQITGQNALQLVQRIREMLVKNDETLKKIKMRADAFFGKDIFHSMQKEMMKESTLPHD